MQYELIVALDYLCGWNRPIKDNLSKQARLREIAARSRFLHFKVIWCPEAQGVVMTDTMHSAGIDLYWPPEIAYQIVLVGVPLP